MPSRYRCCVEADIQATGVAAKRLARRLQPDVMQSLLSLHVNTRRIRIEAGAVCVLAYGSQKKGGIREAMILIGRGNRCRTCSTKSYLFSAGRLFVALCISNTGPMDALSQIIRCLILS